MFLKDSLQQWDRKQNKQFLCQKEMENLAAFSGESLSRILSNAYGYVEQQHKEWVCEQNSVIFHFSITQADNERKKRSFYA